MDNQIVITWSQAEAEAERIQKQQAQIAEQKLQEFMESSIAMLDARDIGYYAELTGKTPNELRREHPDNNLNSLLRTFEGDSSDYVIRFF